jgi:pyrimidine-nucleoside phosphorylase
VRAQGGDDAYLEHPERYPASKHNVEITARRDGFITSIDSLELGFAGIMLGAGRTKVDDVIDPKAGILLKKKSGDRVTRGDVVADVFTDNNQALLPAAERIARAFSYGDTAPVFGPIVISRVDRSGVSAFSA